MKMLEVVEFSPSFRRMSPEAIAYAIRYGAAKVDNLLSLDSYDKIEDNGGIEGETPSKIALLAPELGYYMKLLGINDETEGFGTNSYTAYPTSYVHTDENIEFGLSLLMSPEKSAILGASTEHFTDNQMPERVWQYGPRDAIVIRQKVTKFNGDEVNLGAAFHVASRQEEAAIEVIDLHARNIKVAMATPPYESVA